MATAKQPIAFIGLGAMGFGMATQLVKQGYPVRGFDAYPPTLDRFRNAGGMVASTPAACVQGMRCCIVMVANKMQAQSALLSGPDPAAPALTRDAVLMLTSTVSCGYVQQLAQDLHQVGRGDVKLVDCPVSGGTERAAQGTLSIMAGASQDALDFASDVLKALSSPDQLYLVTGGVGAGSNMKMCHQVLAAAQILGTAEAIGFAARLGLDLSAVRQAVIGSEAWSWIFENRSARSVGAWRTGPVLSAVSIIAKDTSIITSEGRRLDFATPMSSTVDQVYQQALTRGWEREDDSAMVKMYHSGIDHESVDGGGTDSGAHKLALVKRLLIGIYLCASAEALVLAKHAGLDLQQFYRLVCSAAGASALLRSSVCAEMVDFLSGSNPPPISNLIEDFKEVVDEAGRLKCPLFLGAQVLNATMTCHRRGATSVAEVVKYWM